MIEKKKVIKKIHLSLSQLFLPPSLYTPSRLWQMRSEEKGLFWLEIAFWKNTCVSEWYHGASWETGVVAWLLYCWFLGYSLKKRNPEKMC